MRTIVVLLCSALTIGFWHWKNKAARFETELSDRSVMIGLDLPGHLGSLNYLLTRELESHGVRFERLSIDETTGLTRDLLIPSSRQPLAPEVMVMTVQARPTERSGATNFTLQVNFTTDAQRWDGNSIQVRGVDLDAQKRLARRIFKMARQYAADHPQQVRPFDFSREMAAH